MKHSSQKKSIVETCFFALLYTSFFLPLIVYTRVWKPFETPKMFFLSLVIELILPFYIILLVRYPDLRPSRKNLFLLTFIGFLILESISAFLGKDPLNSLFGNSERLDGLFLWWHLPLLYLYLDCAFRLNAKAKNIILNLFLINVGIAAGIGCLQAIHLIPLSTLQFGNRITSTFGNPNFFAGMLVIPFFLAFDRLRLTIWTKRMYFYGIIALLCLLGIFISQTRGAFVGILFGSIVYAIGLLVRSTHSKRLLLAIVFFFVATISILFVFTARNHFPTNSFPYRITHFQDESALSRIIYWDYAWRGFTKNPWFGVGHQNFYTIADTFYETNKFPTQLEWPDKPHNMFLEILATGGIFVFVSYLFLFIFATRSAWKQHESNPFISSAGLISALAGYGIQNLFTFDVTETLFALIVLFVFMTQQTNQKMITKSLAKPHKIFWIFTLIPLLGYSLFLHPFMKQMHQVFIIETNLQKNLPLAIETLRQATHMSFIQDPILLATEFEKILHTTISSKIAINETLEKLFTETLTTYNNAIKQHPSRTFLLNELGNVAYMYAAVTKTKIAPEIISQVEYARQLAPGRIEPLLTLMNLYRVNENLDLANRYAKAVRDMNPTQPIYLWKLALYYALTEDWENASSLGLQALHIRSSIVQNVNQLDWLIQYTQFKMKMDEKSKSELVFLSEIATELEPNNPTLRRKLMEAYAKNHQQDDLIKTADFLKKQDPSATASIDQYIRSLRISP